MTATTPQGTIWVCVDCMMTRETGEQPEDCDREPWGLDTDWDVTLGGNCPTTDKGTLIEVDCYMGECDCNENPFSHSVCDGCGSALAGSRHAYTYWMVSE